MSTTLLHTVCVYLCVLFGMSCYGMCTYGRVSDRRTNKHTACKGWAGRFLEAFSTSWMQSNAVRADCGSGGKVTRPLVRGPGAGTLAPPGPVCEWVSTDIDFDRSNKVVSPLQTPGKRTERSGAVTQISAVTRKEHHFTANLTWIGSLKQVNFFSAGATSWVMTRNTYWPSWVQEKTLISQNNIQVILTYTSFCDWNKEAKWKSRSRRHKKTLAGTDRTKKRSSLVYEEPNRPLHLEFLLFSFLF